MSVIESGIVTVTGTVYVGETLRRAVRRDEAIGYTIVSDDRGLHRWTADGDRWDHYQYRFIYRFMGRTASVTWRCGSLYGRPKPLDALSSMFFDAGTIAYETFSRSWAADLGYDDLRQAERVYRACERVNDRLDQLFGEHREAWERLCSED